MSRSAWKIQTLLLLASISTVDLYSELFWTRLTSSSTKVPEDPHLSRDFPKHLEEKAPTLPLPTQPSLLQPCHVPGCSGRSSAVAEGRERIPEAGSGGGVCGSAPGQHAAHCSGYVWGFLCRGCVCFGSQQAACTLLDFISERLVKFVIWKRHGSC